MSRIEKMRAAQKLPPRTPQKAVEPHAPPIVVKVAPVEAVSAPAKPETAMHTCGHEVAVSKRIKELCNRPCDDCMVEVRKARNERKKVKALAKRVAQGRADPRTNMDIGRLPDGAVFHSVYHADSRTWTGTLDIPGLHTLTATDSGIMWLLRNLDLKYRDSLPKELDADAPPR